MQVLGSENLRVLIFLIWGGYLYVEPKFSFETEAQFLLYVIVGNITCSIRHLETSKNQPISQIKWHDNWVS